MTRVLFLVLEMMLTSTALIVAWFPDHTWIPKFHNWKPSIADFFSLTRNFMLTRSLLQSEIFRPRIKTPLCLKMHTLVMSKAIKLSLVTLWQVRTCSIAVCLSLPSQSWFLSYRVSLVFFVSDHVYT
jgi:hypothetical protein